MKFPYIKNVQKTKEYTSVFGGYYHDNSAQDGQFYDMKNMSTEDYPFMTPRKRRMTSKKFTNLMGIKEKGDSLVWIDDGKLYIDNVEKTLTNATISTDEDMLPKRIYTMGAYIVIFPDKIWYNTKDNSHGSIVSRLDVSTSASVKFEVADGNYSVYGSKIHDESYYNGKTPNDGDVMRITKDGKTSLRVYYGALKMWSSIATTYVKITYSGIGNYFNEEDGLKITTSSVPDWGKNLFVNDEKDGKASINTYVAAKGDNYIIIPGIISSDQNSSLGFTFERKCEDMPYITECQNRLWGCSKDGHEIYCSKQGDPKNWCYYKGVSLDSWAATVGSDGEFTGAVTYNQNPIFFKEDRMIKVTVSASGAHSYRDISCPGVQNGSYKSITEINSVLYYKSNMGVYAYDGSVPQLISDALGVPIYHDAVGGTVNYRYYLCMKEAKGDASLFVYDTRKGLWSKEDNTYSDYFVIHDDDLFFVRDNRLVSVYGSNVYEDGTLEKPIRWEAESGYIGFNMSDAKYLSRLNVRMLLALGSYADFYIEYDSSGHWEHIFNMVGRGTQTFNIPVKPHRCDHFRYKISGLGECKVFAITKEIEEGSDGQ